MLTVRFIPISISSQFACSCSSANAHNAPAAVEGGVGILWQLLPGVVCFSRNFVLLALNTAASSDNSVPGTVPDSALGIVPGMMLPVDAYESSASRMNAKVQLSQSGPRIPPHNVALATLPSSVNGRSIQSASVSFCSQVDCSLLASLGGALIKKCEINTVLCSAQNVKRVDCKQCSPIAVYCNTAQQHAQYVNSCKQIRSLASADACQFFLQITPQPLCTCNGMRVLSSASMPQKLVRAFCSFPVLSACINCHS